MSAGSLTRTELLLRLRASESHPGARSGLSQCWPGWMPRMAFTGYERGRAGDVLLVIFLRGAADGLNMVVPHGELAYYHNRPALAIPRPDDRGVALVERALDLDGFFGLHPALRPLLPAWQAGHLAIVHACGAPDESRSHFKAMELIERGVEDMQGPASGWINRHLGSLDTVNPSPMRAVGFGGSAPRSLHGAVPVTALRSITDFHLQGRSELATMMKAGLNTLYSGGDTLGQLGRETLEILSALEVLDPQTYRVTGDLPYPDTDFGHSLRQIAMLVKAEVGLEVAAVDLGGWDTHFAQGGSEGWMAGLLADLGSGLAALHRDLASFLDELTVVVMTEFGRRVKENASLGTDHGHAGVMLLLGGHVQGGMVHGAWPGLEDGQLFGPGDLAITTDYRDVLSEICAVRLRNPAPDRIFMGYTTQHTGFVR